MNIYVNKAIHMYSSQHFKNQVHPSDMKPYKDLIWENISYYTSCGEESTTHILLSDMVLNGAMCLRLQGLCLAYMYLNK
jgi:hypothetical protein